jgi:hypothetical protein
MRVVLEAPVAAADAEAGMKPRLVPVSGLQINDVWRYAVICYSVL